MRELKGRVHDLADEVTNINRQADASARLVRSLDAQLVTLGDDPHCGARGRTCRVGPFMQYQGPTEQGQGGTADGFRVVHLHVASVPARPGLAHACRHLVPGACSGETRRLLRWSMR
jgi:hypothetical protein